MDDLVRCLREFGDHAPMLVSAKDLQGVILYANGRFAELEAGAPETWIGRSVFELFPPLVAQALWENDVAAALSELPVVAEETVIDRQGRSRTYLTVKFALRGEAGQVVGTCAISPEITDLSTAHATVRESEQQLGALLDSLPLMVFAKEAEGLRFVRLNRAGEQLTGLSREHVIGRTDHDLFPEEQATAFARADREALASGGPVEIAQEPFRSPHGDRLLRTRRVAVRHPDGRPRYLLGLSEDITGERTAAATRLEDDARLTLATEASNTGLWDWDLRSNEVYLSAIWKRQIGFADDELPSAFSSWRDRLHPEDAPEVLAALRDYLEGRSPAYSVEFRLRHRDGSYRWILARGAFAPSPEGAPRRLVGIHVDLTEKRQAEDTIRDQADRLRALAHSLASTEQRVRHEVSRILHDDVQQLLVAASLRLSRLATPEPGASAQLDEVLALLTQCLDATRSLATQLSPPVLREGRLDLALAWLIDWFAETHGLSVDSSIAATPATTAEVLECLFAATRELLFNVVKHAGVTTATLHVTYAAPSLEVVVRDQGAGCDPSSALSPRSAGASGLGLVAIRERLVALGGDLTVSGAPGAGFSARARLLNVADAGGVASTAPPAEGSPVAADPPPGPRTIRIVIADDHAFVRAGLRQVLESVPTWEVVGEAGTGVEAIRLCGELEPDVVLMDISMPVMSGLEATREVCRQSPLTAVIGLSMHDDAVMISNMQAAGARSYVNKAAPVEVLIGAIAAVVAPARPDTGSAVPATP